MLKIEQDPNGYVILNGDLINNAIKTSVSDTYMETMSPEKQIDTLVELFTPIKDRILSIVTSNHEERTWRLVGLDPTRNFAYKLGLSDLYNPVSNILFVSFGKSRKRENRRNTLASIIRTVEVEERLLELKQIEFITYQALFTLTFISIHILILH